MSSNCPKRSAVVTGHAFPVRFLLILPVPADVRAEEPDETLTVDEVGHLDDRLEKNDLLGQAESAFLDAVVDVPLDVDERVLVHVGNLLLRELHLLGLLHGGDVLRCVLLLLQLPALLVLVRYVLVPFGASESLGIRVRLDLALVTGLSLRSFVGHSRNYVVLLGLVRVEEAEEGLA